MNDSALDRELLREFTERGSESAFRALVQRHADLVFAAAMRRLGDQAAAQDLTQEVFIALARKAAWLRVEKSLAGWLYKTTLFKARQWWRGEARRRQREQTAIQLKTTMDQDDLPLDSLQGVLDEGLLELRERDRQALLLRFFERCNHRQIGTVLGIGEDAARKRVDKALAQLAGFFKKRGYTVGSVAGAAAALDAAALSAPAELVAQTAHAALAQAGPGALHWLARFLRPNKAYTAALCTALLVGPGLWQGARWVSAVEEQGRLKALLASLQAQQQQVAQDKGQVQRQLRRTSNRLAQLQILSKYTGLLTEAHLDPRLFRWDESVDFVRVSKAALRWLTFDNGQQDEEKTVNFQTKPVSATLLGALGLSNDEQAHVQQFFRTEMETYRVAAEARGYVTNLSSPDRAYGFVAVNSDSRAWVTPPLSPEESTMWSRRFEKDLAALVGAERTEIILRNANEDYSLGACFQRFGAEDSVFAITPLPEGGCKVIRQDHFLDGKPRWLCSASLPLSAVLDPSFQRPPGPSVPPAADNLWHILRGQSLPPALLEYVRQWAATHSDVPDQPAP